MPLRHFLLLSMAGLLSLVLGPQVEAEPLSQAEAVQLALEHNPRVAAAREAWRQARARIWPARLLPDPEVSLEYEALPGALRLNRFGERSFGIAQILEFPAKPYLRGRIAQREAQAAWLEYESIRIEVAAEVEKACGRLWASQRRREYAEENLRLAAEFRDKTRVRLEAGDVSRVEALRAEVEAGRAAAEQAAAANQVRQARAALNNLLTQDLSMPIEVRDGLGYTPIEAELQDLQRRALARRPDLRSAQALVEGAKATQTLAALALLPDFDLWLASQQIRGEGDFWKAGFTATVPLWAWGRQRAEIAGTRAGAARAQAEQRATHQQALLEVQAAYLEVETAEKQVLLYRDRLLPSAEEAYQLVRQRYSEGGASYLEVIDAGRTLTEARQAWVEALLDFHEAVAELTRAVGGRIGE